LYILYFGGHFLDSQKGTLLSSSLESTFSFSPLLTSALGMQFAGEGDKRAMLLYGRFFTTLRIYDWLLLAFHTTGSARAAGRVRSWLGEMVCRCGDTVWAVQARSLARPGLTGWIVQTVG
jgi:hypothetical protein